MNTERDPQLEALFEAAEQDLTDDAFTAAVESRMTSRRRWIVFSRVAVLAAFIALEVLLESPVRHYLGVVADVLGASLIPTEGEWLTFVVGPINSVAGLLGVLLLGLNYLYRKIAY